MKVAIISPYLDTLGGGERYLMTAAQIISQENKVDVLLNKHLFSLNVEKLKKDLEQRFNLNLEKVKFIEAPVGKGSSAFKRFLFLKQYDLLIYLTDGSIFYPFAKRNILHIQSPLIGQPAKGLWGKIKLKGWDMIIYNSKFTQNNSLKNWPITSTVIYPPVDVKNIKPLKKKNYILSVGRFFGYLKDKKQELLIQAFEQIYKLGKINSWSLHLAGSASEGDKQYLSDLEKMSVGLPIKFYPNIHYQDLVKLYGESSIYWHAAGYGESEPTKMEHFGISVVEAMAGGCIPLVVNKGGLVEIVQDNISGMLWLDINDLKMKTIKLISDLELQEKISQSATERARNFSKDKFEKALLEIVK